MTSTLHARRGFPALSPTHERETESRESIAARKSILAKYLGRPQPVKFVSYSLP